MRYHIKLAIDSHQARGGFHTSQIRHLSVHDDDVWGMGPSQLQSDAAGGALCHDLYRGWSSRQRRMSARVISESSMIMTRTMRLPSMTGSVLSGAPCEERVSCRGCVLVFAVSSVRETRPGDLAASWLATKSEAALLVITRHRRSRRYLAVRLLEYDRGLPDAEVARILEHVDVGAAFRAEEPPGQF